MKSPQTLLHALARGMAHHLRRAGLCARLSRIVIKATTQNAHIVYVSAADGTCPVSILCWEDGACETVRDDERVGRCFLYEDPQFLDQLARHLKRLACLRGSSRVRS